MILFFISGCSDKKYIHEPLKNELLAYTSKAEIIKENDRILILGVYLNPITSEYDKERFVLAIYPKDSELKTNSFALNGSKSQILVKSIEYNDELLNKVSFKMPWGAYYEVVSPAISSDTLTLTFEIRDLNAVALKFQKVSKSMYWNGGVANRWCN